MPTLQSIDALNADQLKTLLGLSVARVKEVSDALETNWTIQLISAAVGIALVYKIADLPNIRSVRQNLEKIQLLVGDVGVSVPGGIGK